MTVTSEYEYAPLQSMKQFRILIVKPSVDCMDAELSCSLDTAFFDSGAEAEYTALSYSWAMQNGDAALTRHIRIDGKSKNVTQNLFEALRQLRLRQHELRLWVDAVCINQDDHQERSSQVARMCSIFSGAKQVIAWLGEGECAAEDSNMHAVLDCLGRGEQHRLLSRLPSHDRADHSLDVGTSTVSLCDVLSGHAAESEQRRRVFNCIEDTLMVFLTRRYWSRRWIMQEINGKNDTPVTLCWGQHSISKASAMDAVDCIISNAPSLGIAERGPCFEKLLRLHTSLFDSPEVPLEQILQLCCDAKMQCSDPRDLLFSLINLDEECSIVPDYGKTTREVFTEFAISLISRQRLDIVLKNSGLNHSIDRDPALPSWVPDLQLGFECFWSTPLSIAEVDTTTSILRYHAYELGVAIETDDSTTEDPTFTFRPRQNTSRLPAASFVSQWRIRASKYRLSRNDVLCDIAPSLGWQRETYTGYLLHIIRPVPQSDTYKLVGAARDLWLQQGLPTPMLSTPVRFDELDSFLVQLA